MGSHLEVLFALLLVLVVTPVWLAPAPPSPALALDSPLEDFASAASSVRAKQEPFLVQPAADNVPKVDKYYSYKHVVFQFSILHKPAFGPKCCSDTIMV